MRKRKIVSRLFAIVLIMSMVLSGCSGAKKTKDTSSEGQPTSEAKTTGEASDPAAIDHSEPLTLEVYDCAANFQGEQTGWFGKVLKDNFNITLNIIAPNISGDADALFLTRCASGNLGDIIILENAPAQDCIQVGLLADLTKELPKWENLSKFNDNITLFNSTLQGAEDKIFVLPNNMSDAAATDYGLTKMNGPFMPFDYYAELGYPKIKTDEDLLNVLDQMMKAHPTNDAGDSAYAFSLWSDWDNTSVENVNQLVPWYGDFVNESLLINAKGEMKDLTADDGSYKKMLHLLYTANQKGLVDPDSGTQKWDAAMAKMQNKQVYLFWYWWQTGFYNTPDRSNKDEGYTYVPVADHHYIQMSDGSFGDGKIWAIGSQVDEVKKARIMELLDWMAGNEGNLIINCGMKDFNYRVRPDGKYESIPENANCLNDNTEVPAEYGGGGYADGNNKLNVTLTSAETMNPLTGEPYAADRWSTYAEQNKTKLTDDWGTQFGYPDQMAYLKANNMVDIVPNVNICMDADTTDIGLTRSQCSQLIKDTTWRMIFANSEEEFNSMWAELKDKLDGLSWADVVAFDKVKYQKLIDARIAALK